MYLSSLLVSYGDYFKDENGNKHYDYPDIWTSFAKDALANVFLYVAIALAVILVCVGIFVRFKQKDKLANYLKIALSLAVGFAVTVIIAMLALEFYDMNESGSVIDMVLYPAVVLGGTIVLGAAAIYVTSLYGKKALKIGQIVSFSVMGAALVALLVCLGVYFSSGDAESTNEVVITNLENAMLYVCSLLLIGVLLFFAFFLGRKDKKGFDSKSISYAAICIAMSFALSYLSIFKLPQGGSVTIASLLPLMIYSYMFGVKKGIFAGFVYGILQAVQDPWIVHPAQFLLDYPVAFACIGVSGVFSKTKQLERLPQVQIALGAILASVLRYACHLFSGVFAFSEYAFTADGLPMNPWIYSLGYNSFVFADIAIVIAAAILVFSSRSFMRVARKFNTAPAKIEETAETLPLTEAETEAAPADSVQASEVTAEAATAQTEQPVSPPSDETKE